MRIQKRKSDPFESFVANRLKQQSPVSKLCLTRYPLQFVLIQLVTATRLLLGLIHTRQWPSSSECVTEQSLVQDKPLSSSPTLWTLLSPPLSLGVTELSALVSRKISLGPAVDKSDLQPISGETTQMQMKDVTHFTYSQYKARHLDVR